MRTPLEKIEITPMVLVYYTKIKDFLRKSNFIEISNCKTINYLKQLINILSY